MKLRLCRSFFYAINFIYLRMETYENGEYNFNKDLVKGEKGEEFIVSFMQNLGFQFIHKRNDNKYDLMMGYNRYSYSYEIKTDIYPRDTGNIAIEFESRGKPSGIAVTEADFFVTYFPHLKEIWNIQTNKLKKLIDENNIKSVDGAGDPGSNTKLYLVKKSKFKNHFKVHKIT